MSLRLLRGQGGFRIHGILMSKLILILMAASSLCPLVRAQDPQSLGEIARRARQQKQQATPPDNAGNAQDSNAPGKPAQTPHVITNDEIPEQAGSTTPASETRSGPPALPNYKEGKRPAEYWKSQILQLKNNMAFLQRDIDRQNNSIHFADGNYEKHVVWNDRQRQKLQQVENMKSQLEQLQKRLELVQETARRQGYGTSVYDP